MTAEEQRIANAIRERKIQKKRESKTGTEHLTQAELDELLDEIAPLGPDIEQDEPEPELEPEPIPEPRPQQLNPVQAALRRPPSECCREPREMILLKREKALLERELLAMSRIVTELQSLEPASRVAVLARLQRAHT